MKVEAGRAVERCSHRVYTKGQGLYAKLLCSSLVCVCVCVEFLHGVCSCSHCKEEKDWGVRAPVAAFVRRPENLVSTVLLLPPPFE